MNPLKGRRGVGTLAASSPTPPPTVRGVEGELAAKVPTPLLPYFPSLEQIQSPPLVTAVNTPNDGWLPDSCMGVIGALESFFPFEVGGRARAQDFSPTLPRANQIGPSTYPHKF